MTDTSLPISTIHEIRDQRLCLAAQRAAQVFAGRFDRLFAPLGLTNGQLSMMPLLSRPWKPRLGELAEFLAMGSATMTSAAKTLEKWRLVTLLADEDDARARRLALTDAGREVLALAVPLWRDNLSDWAQALR